MIWKFIWKLVDDIGKQFQGFGYSNLFTAECEGDYNHAWIDLAVWTVSLTCEVDTLLNPSFPFFDLLHSAKRVLGPTGISRGRLFFTSVITCDLLCQREGRNTSQSCDHSINGASLALWLSEGLSSLHLNPLQHPPGDSQLQTWILLETPRSVQTLYRRVACFRYIHQATVAWHAAKTENILMLGSELGTFFSHSALRHWVLIALSPKQEVAFQNGHMRSRLPLTKRMGTSCERELIGSAVSPRSVAGGSTFTRNKTGMGQWEKKSFQRGKNGPNRSLQHFCYVISDCQSRSQPRGFNPVQINEPKYTMDLVVLNNEIRGGLFWPN